MMISRFLFFSLIILAAAYSCRPDERFIDSADAKLEFSTDTIIFDTVFTTVGTSTEIFLVYNPHNRPIKIENIRLGGGPSSPYRINIDGEPATSLNDFSIGPNDSIFIFVDVKIDPVSGNHPLIVKDSLIFITNGNYQDVKLVAWGQNAHFMRNVIIPCNTSWIADKPYVIYDDIYIEPGCTLVISEGVQVHGHFDATFHVGGTLIVNGREEMPVVFQGDKLQEFYKDIPHQWFGIVFHAGSQGNFIRHASIRNGVIGILADSMGLQNASDGLRVENTEIRNMSNIGILGLDANIDAKNLVITNCGQALFVGSGGKYRFRHTTFANYNFRFSRSGPSLIFADQSIVPGSRFPDGLQLLIENSIVHGSLEEEIDYVQKGGNWSLDINHSLLRTNRVEFAVNGNILNKDPLFTNPQKYDLELGENSPAIGAGKFIHDITEDMKGRARKINPDLGALERP